MPVTVRLHKVQVGLTDDDGVNACYVEYERMDDPGPILNMEYELNVGDDWGASTLEALAGRDLEDYEWEE